MPELRRTFYPRGETCSTKCDQQLAEKRLAAEAVDFFQQYTSEGGLDSDEARKILHAIVDDAFAEVVAGRRQSFTIVD
jgi:hypothetical protein